MWPRVNAYMEAYVSEDSDRVLDFIPPDIVNRIIFISELHYYRIPVHIDVPALISVHRSVNDGDTPYVYSVPLTSNGTPIARLRQQLPNLPVNRTGMMFTTVEYHLYAVGGCGPDGSDSIGTYRLNLIHPWQGWVQLPAYLPHRVSFGQLTVCGSNLVISGGIRDDHLPNNTLLFLIIHPNPNDFALDWKPMASSTYPTDLEMEGTDSNSSCALNDEIWTHDACLPTYEAHSAVVAFNTTTKQYRHVDVGSMEESNDTVMVHCAGRVFLVGRYGLAPNNGKGDLAKPHTMIREFVSCSPNESLLIDAKPVVDDDEPYQIASHAQSGGHVALNPQNQIPCNADDTFRFMKVVVQPTIRSDRVNHCIIHCLGGVTVNCMNPFSTIRPSGNWTFAVPRVELARLDEVHTYNLIHQSTSTRAR